MARGLGTHRDLPPQQRRNRWTPPVPPQAAGTRQHMPGNQRDPNPEQGDKTRGCRPRQRTERCPRIGGMREDGEVEADRQTRRGGTAWHWSRPRRRGTHACCSRHSKAVSKKLEQPGESRLDKEASMRGRRKRSRKPRGNRLGRLKGARLCASLEKKCNSPETKGDKSWVWCPMVQCTRPIW